MKPLHLQAAIIAARRDFVDQKSGKKPNVSDGPYQSLQEAFESLDAPEALQGLLQNEREALASVSRAFVDFAQEIHKGASE